MIPEVSADVATTTSAEQPEIVSNLLQELAALREQNRWRDANSEPPPFGVEVLGVCAPDDNWYRMIQHGEPGNSYWLCRADTGLFEVVVVVPLKWRPSPAGPESET